MLPPAPPHHRPARRGTMAANRKQCSVWHLVNQWHLHSLPQQSPINQTSINTNQHKTSNPPLQTPPPDCRPCAGCAACAAFPARAAPAAQALATNMVNRLPRVSWQSMHSLRSVPCSRGTRTRHGDRATSSIRRPSCAPEHAKTRRAVASPCNALGPCNALLAAHRSPSRAQRTRAPASCGSWPT